MNEAITSKRTICSVCNVNEVEIGNLQEEICSSCTDEYDDNVGYPRELFFEEPEGRKDDRIRPEPDYEWTEEERDYEV